MKFILRHKYPLLTYFQYVVLKSLPTYNEEHVFPNQGWNLKNLFYWVLATSCFTVTSCSSSLTYPPSQEVIKKYRSEIAKNPSFARGLDLNRLEENERQAFIYLQAENFEKEKKNKAACDRYKYLANDKSFPNAQLALIKSLRVCDYLTLKNVLIWNTSLKDVEPGFRKLFLENSINLADQKQQLEYLVQFGVEYTDFLDTKEQREKHLLKLRKKVSKKKELKTIVEEKLYSIAPRFIPNPTSEDYKAVAKDFGKVREFKKARIYYNKIIKSKNLPLIDKVEAYYQHAFSYKLQRDKKSYAMRLEGLVGWLEKQKHWQIKPDVLSRYWETRIEMSKAFWTIDFRTKASKELQEIVQNPTSPVKVKAIGYLTLGLIELEKKKNAEAEQYFLSGLQQSEIDEETLQDLSWSLGWNYFIDYKLNKAKTIFESAIEKSKDSSFKRKLEFWQAKTLYKLGKLEEAKDIWEEILEESSFDYYGIISSLELGTSLKKIDPAIAQEDQYTPSKTPYPILDWLVAYEDWDLAEEFLKNKQKEMTTTEDIESILPLYHFAKWYDGGIFKFYRIPSEEREEALESHILAAFPTPFKEEFLNAEKRFGVPASFLFSIARQESSFNEHARSWADAFGVLQVTPEKAKQFSRKYSITYKNYSDLYNPEINIPIGSALLKNLLSNGRGTFISSVASYNAGKKPVNGWYKVRHRKDPIEFIEMVSYRETRKYLKLVLRNLVTYKRLLGENVKLERDFLTNKLLKN